MAEISKRRKGGSKVIPNLSTAIDTLNLAKGATSATPATLALGSVATLLTMIEVSSLPFRDKMILAHI